MPSGITTRDAQLGVEGCRWGQEFVMLNVRFLAAIGANGGELPHEAEVANVVHMPL